MRFIVHFRIRRRARRLLHNLVSRYDTLPSRHPHFEKILVDLDSAIRTQDIEQVEHHMHLASEEAARLMPEKTWRKFLDWFVGFGFAFFLALLIRQMWFELYTIPSGSMRPTLREGDFLLVSKASFSLNVPFTPQHVLFNPDLLKRGEIVVFTSENLPIADTHTTNFWIFPAVKQYVKRLIGKPGDTLYFYGGQIYGLDASQQPLDTLRDPAYMSSLEYVPVIRFEDRVETSTLPKGGMFPSVLLYQMNQKIARLTTRNSGQVTGELLGPYAQAPSYGALWGMDNYAQARLLFPHEAPPSSASLTLELTHHPTLEGAHLIRDSMGRLRPALGTSRSYIPLSQEHITRLARALTTARFEVKNGVAQRLGSRNQIPFTTVPDGIYEIIQGTGYSLHAGDIATPLPLDHPLLRDDPVTVRFLFNQGIDWDGGEDPSRFAYYRDNSLYLLNAPIFTCDDPTLCAFTASEQKKALCPPYVPFLDAGPPTSSTISTLGLTLPANSALVLGDNHAMSADSRRFGPIPYENLRGSPSLLFWPPGPRWGFIPGPAHPFWTPGQLILWSLLALILLAESLRYRRRWHKPLTFN